MSTLVSDSSDDARFVSNKTFYSENTSSKYVTTAKNDKPLFPLRPSSTLRIGSASQVALFGCAFQNRHAAMLAAEVKTRRAELELRRIEYRA